MSANNPSRRGKFQPTEEPPEPARLTFDEFAQFKKLFEDSPLSKYVKLAGIGGVAGLVLVFIELVRVAAYLYQHFK
jgi:hypothetical protein